MKTYILKISYLLVLFGVSMACNSSKNNENELQSDKLNENTIEITKSQFERSKMELGKISLQKFSESIKTNGFIDVPPANKAKVSVVMSGYIKSLPLLVGNNVEKGQLLLTIENPDFIDMQQSYLEHSEQLNYLKSEYDRQAILFKENITAKKDYLKAESTYKSTLAVYKGLEQKLKMMNIKPQNVLDGMITSIIAVYAPISGTVTSVFANVGEFKEPSEVVLEIINIDHKHLELIVFEKDILKVEENQEIYFRVPESSSNIHKADVYLVGKSIDENRTARVHGHLENEDNPFLVGMFVEAEIVFGASQKLSLPLSAFQEENDNYYILVLTEKNETSYKFEKVSVEIGNKNEKWIELTDLNPDLEDEQILIGGGF